MATHYKEASKGFITAVVCHLFALANYGLLTATSALASGPGLGQLTYSPDEVMQPISLIQTPSWTTLPTGEGYVHMVDGYLFVPFSRDGNQTQGGFAFYDISDPRDPVAVYTYHNDETYPMVEPHGYGFSEGRLVYCTNTGIVVWDISDPAAPEKLSSINLGTTVGYNNVCWSVAYQAPYAYVGTGTSGLQVVDLTDPTNPVLVSKLSQSELGSVPIHNIHVVGNLLVATATADRRGYATIDISDPATPVLLEAQTSNSVPLVYSGYVNGNRLYGMSNDGYLHIHDISDATQFTLLDRVYASVPNGGGYASIQDNYVFGGFGKIFAKFDVRQPNDALLVDTGSRHVADSDMDFVVPLGNLVFVGNDHGNGSSFYVHQAEPDTTAPSVNMFSPTDGDINQAITTRVGITLTDMVSIESVNTDSFIVQPQGGTPLPGTYSVQFDKVNFWPDSPLQPDTIYEILIPEGGIEDWSGNPLISAFSSSFSTGPSTPQASRLTCTIDLEAPAPVIDTVAFNGVANNAQGIVTYSWDFGDGVTTSESLESAVVHTYAAADNYPVILTVSDDDESASCSTIRVIHNPLTEHQPTRSATIIFDTERGLAYNVNPDNDTVTAVTESGDKRWEIPVGRKPVSLAKVPDDNIWIVNQDHASISVVSPDDNKILTTLALPYASRPYGIAVAPDNSAIYVTLEATGKLLKLDPSTGNIITSLEVGTTPRGIAISGDSSRLLVTRFVSPQDHGVVTEVALDDFIVKKIYTLAVDEGPDTEASGRGVPNYLNSVSISPDGLRANVASKKDNTQRGVFRDGNNLDFETTVRAISSQLDLENEQELIADRVDINDSSLPIDSVYNRFGNHLFIVMMGSNRIEIRDAYDLTQVIGAIEGTGFAPDGIALNENETLLFVHNFLSRTITIYDISGFTSGRNSVATQVGEASTVANEQLEPEVLQGKRIFHDANDRRMSRDGYLSCAVCHFDGMSDERIWDVTGRGEGFRNTISLHGRGGMGHGNVHWTANFDEIQDFENDIRFAFGGTGLMADVDFNHGTRSDPLGDPKAGLSSDLDALAAYTSSLVDAHKSPHRNPDGSLTDDAIQGKSLFNGKVACSDCHSGPNFTDQQRHDVGTVKAHSGSGSGMPLSGVGFDTPTLLGIWETAPYLHDGSAITLSEVLDNPNHGNTASLTTVEKTMLIAYLLQLQADDVMEEPDQSGSATQSTGSSSILLPLIALLALACRALTKRYLTARQAAKFR